MISGTKLAGKSTLSKLLMHNINYEQINILSTDTVLHIMRKYTNKKNDPVLHMDVSS